MRRVLTLCLSVASLLFAFGISEGIARCCPFCSAPSQTLAEQVAQADGVCLVHWVSGQPAREQDPGNSTYEVLQVVKGSAQNVKKGDRLVLARYRAGKKGDLFLLMGTRAGRGNAIDWGSPTEITETGFNYVAQAPLPEVPAPKRLAYFLKFLEFPDQLISNDAYAEFANAPYKDIAAVAPLMPKERIRAWISRPETPQTRIGLYGLFLGLCGTEADSKVLAEKISQKTEDFRIGIDGLISGYLLLTGGAGLEHIDEWKFKDTKVPFSETYAAMMGLRFMWQYAGGRISNERLMQSMRLLLDRPELADLVIADLARWNDWSVQDRLMRIYGKGAFNIPSVKRAIIRYMLASTQGKPAGNPAAIPGGKPAENPASRTNGNQQHAVDGVDFAQRGKKYLEELRKKDPRTVKEAERFFFVN